LLTIQLVGWKTREAIFHARQEGNPDNSTPPRVDGFGHPPYVRLGIASKLAPTGCGTCRALGFWQLVGWKTRDAIFHAGQEGNPDNSTLPRVDGFGHPPYVRLGDRQQAGSYGMWDLSGPGVLADTKKAS